jgi:hypothetical protein
MSATPGKVMVEDILELNGETVFALRLIQGRNPEWCNKLFFAKYEPDAAWYDQLRPAFGEREWFFQRELDSLVDDLVAQVSRATRRPLVTSG